MEHERAAAVRLAVEFAHAAEVHDQRAVHADEVSCAIEHAFQRVHAQRNEMGLRLRVDSGIVAFGLDPVDAIDIDEHDARAVAHGESARELCPRLGPLPDGQLARLGAAHAARMADGPLAEAFAVLTADPLRGVSDLPRLQRELKLLRVMPTRLEALRAGAPVTR